MRIIGLTGALGAGKSTAANLFRSMGVPVHDADAVVHQLLETETVRQVLASRFPELCLEPKVDRGQLGDIVFKDAQALAWLEDVLHPLVHESQHAFLNHHAQAESSQVVLDVPLLFETGQDKACDHVVVIQAPDALRYQRVLARSGMSRQRFDQIERHQMPVAEKMKKADTVVPNDSDQAHLYNGLCQVLEQVKDLKKPAVWGPNWLALCKKDR